mmetsp:Transcript_46104/g.97840  ORF Transcript_46104/g.97840 Transcript_46104/m.97840 type:complete len:96 (+) Transcript_46104:508-795(+)
MNRQLPLVRASSLTRMGHGTAKKYRRRVESNLASILTESERKVFEIIMDDGNGPFAQVWKEGGHAWDGKEEARKFWSKVEGGREDAEIRMRARRS